jgi:hypothetical protein
MTKVYIVTDGEYSDYHIVGVFSTREIAESVLRACYADGVEEHEVDSKIVLDAEFGPIYTVEILLEEGKINKHFTCTGTRSRTSAEIFHVPYASFINCLGCLIEESERLIVRSPFSSEHAEKIAVESRQKWLRNGNKWEERECTV